MWLHSFPCSSFIPGQHTDMFVSYRSFVNCTLLVAQWWYIGFTCMFPRNPSHHYHDFRQSFTVLFTNTKTNKWWHHCILQLCCEYVYVPERSQSANPSEECESSSPVHSRALKDERIQYSFATSCLENTRSSSQSEQVSSFFQLSKVRTLWLCQKGPLKPDDKCKQINKKKLRATKTPANSKQELERH